MPVDELIVEVTRGRLVESRHLVHAVVARADGDVLAGWGALDRRVHARSAIKPVQALPLVESGAADAYGLGDVELALACASHNGEPEHVAAVRSWLTAIGCDAEDLGCGSQAGRPEGPIANNCSGKHAGFLTVARHLGVDPAGYLRPDHPVQQLVTAAITEVFDVSIDPALIGVDGCGIPVHPLPLSALAAGMARFSQPPPGWSSARVAAANRLAGAMAAQPFFVVGTGRLCTEVMSVTGGHVLAKTGAEGVYLLGLREPGLGISVKVEDGARRAAEAAALWLLGRRGVELPAALLDERRIVRNHAGRAVGEIRVVEP